MTQPGSIGNLVPPGDDWIARRLEAIERRITAVETGRSLESASIGDGGLRSENFDGDLATGTAGTEGWGLGGPDGKYAIFNDIVLRGGIIGNAALTNPLRADANAARVSGFGTQTGTYAVLASFNFTVPTGFTNGLFTAVGIVNAYNDSSSSDYIWVTTNINGTNGEGLYNGIAGNGGGDGTLNVQYASVTGLTDGQLVPIQVKASTSFAAWSANANNWASVSAQVIWTR